MCQQKLKKVWINRWSDQLERNSRILGLKVSAIVAQAACMGWTLAHGRYLAFGPDDQVILIHDWKSCSGTSEFGSGEPPDVENWKVVMTLRVHNADVVIIFHNCTHAVHLPLFFLHKHLQNLCCYSFFSSYLITFCYCYCLTIEHHFLFLCLK
jgi:hypothetical protein